MSDRRWSANSFDAARDEVIDTLRKYRVERQNIKRDKELLREAINGLYAPSSGGGDHDGGRAQTLHGDDAMVRTLGKIEGERRTLDREMRIVQEKENRLNMYLAAIMTLPTFERRVVVGIYIDSEDIEDLRAGKSEEVVYKHRKSAIKKLTRMLFRVEVKTCGQSSVPQSTPNDLHNP